MPDLDLIKQVEQGHRLPAADVWRVGSGGCSERGSVRISCNSRADGDLNGEDHEDEFRPYFDQPCRQPAAPGYADRGVSGA